MITKLTEKELREDISERGRGPAYLFSPRVIRQKKLAGETYRDAKARWDREAALEADRDREARRVYTGQILPVFQEE